MSNPVHISGSVSVRASGEAGADGLRGGQDVTPLIGTWVRGDTGKALFYTVLQGGVARDLTAATAPVLTMVRRASDVDTTVTISGHIGGVTISTETGLIEFSHDAGTAIGTAVASPASRLQSDVYHCRISFTQAGETFYTDPFRIAVVKFP